MVQESGRVRHLGEPGVRNGEELDLRFNSAIPQPVRQRLQIALRAGEEAPQEQVYDSGLPRHFAGYHLQKPSKEIPHHGQHVSARLERHLCRKRLDPHAAGRRRRQGDQTGLSLCIEDPEKTSKYEGGSSVEIGFDRTFGKTGYLRYITTIFSFYGWITDIGQKNKISDYTKYLEAYDKWADKEDTSVGHDIKDKPRLPIHPTVRWENTLEIKATKYLSTKVSFQLYYNRAQNVDVQTRTLLQVGLTYTFKNKPKP